MRGVYTAEIEIAALNPTAGDGLLTLEVPADMVIEILSASITNMDIDTAEQLEGGLFGITTKGSLAGTSITPEKHETGDAASTVTALGAGNAGMTTEPDAWNSKAYDRQGFNNLAGYRYDPIPEERPVISPSKLVGLRLLAAPSGAFKAAVQIVFREIGG
jgi:hypothetical protein